MSVDLSWFETPATALRQRIGMATTCWISRSFIRTKCAARLIGSISLEAARQTRANSSLRQRVLLRPCHLFSLAATSQVVHWARRVGGRGAAGACWYLGMVGCE